MNKFTYRWNLTDLENVPKNGLKVFSCFACAGGSTMGYKMSGFDVIGANEIDPEMASTYKLNHNPKYFFLEPIQTFKNRKDLPSELYNLDILDGSPPCSSFSMSGSREKAWGKKKKFREGQAEQILDDLFFHFIDLAHKLQPKFVVAENVKGMLLGNAKGYVKQIIHLFNVSGYDVQLFLLNAASMGVPQKRERVFFICRRKDLNLPDLKLGWNEAPVFFKEIEDKLDKSENITLDQKKWWQITKPGKLFSSAHPKGHYFNSFKISPNIVCPTLIAAKGATGIYHYLYPRKLNQNEMKMCQSFPLDFRSNNLTYQIGMSVPPLMIHKISEQIHKQFFLRGLNGQA